MSNSATPAIIYLLWPKNLRVLESYLDRNGSRHILTFTPYCSEELKAAATQHGCQMHVIDDLLSASRKAEIPRVATELLNVLNEPVGAVECKASQQVKMSFLEVAAKYTPTLLTIISALDEMAAEFPIEIALFNEDWLTYSKAIWLWTKARGIPSLQISHNPGAISMYTVHGDHNSDMIAIDSETTLAEWIDAGFDPARLAVTGLPHMDVIAEQRPYRQDWRKRICTWHGFDSGKPIVVYGTTWAANLSFLENPNKSVDALRAYFGAIKAVGNRAQHIIKDRPATGREAKEVVYSVARSMGVQESDFIYVANPPIPQRVTSEALVPYILGADLVVSQDSGLTLDALTAGTRALNLCTDDLFIYTPTCPGDVSGIQQSDAVGLPEAILTALGTASSPLRTDESLSRINAGWDGKATERVVQLIEGMALRAPAILPYKIYPSRPKRRKQPQIWESLLQVDTTVATGYHGGVRDGLVDLSPRPIRCALDIGCAAGGTGAYIKSKYPKSKVIGIEVNRSAAEYAKQKLDHVLIGRFEEVNLADAGIKPGSIDTVIVADVLEHMYDPWSVLTTLRPWLTMDAQIIASIPNVRNLKLMEDLAAGYWRYEDSGLLDITHIRFFTLKEIRRFFHETGYHIRTLNYAIDPRLSAMHTQLRGRTGPQTLRLGKMTLHDIEGEELDELCSLQFYLIAGHNALIKDIEGYRSTSPEQLLLNRFLPTPQEGALWEKYIATWPHRPVIHICLLDTAGNSEAISLTINSLAQQLYAVTRITIISPSPCPDNLSTGEKIQWQHVVRGRYPFATVNLVLAQETSAWLGILYAGDLLEQGGLLHMMTLAQQNPDVRCLYSDDTRLNQGQPGNFNFKPDFDPWLLMGQDYLSSGLILFSTAWLRESGGFSDDLRGREVFDAALRLHEQHGQGAFGHLPEPVLHRPVSGNDGDLPFAQVNQSHRESLRRLAAQRGEIMDVDEGWLPGTLRIRHHLVGTPVVSILMLVEADTPPFQAELETLLEKTSYPHFEILILDSGAKNPATRDFILCLDALAAQQLRVFRLNNPTNPVQAANLLAEQAAGDMLLFFRPGLVPTHPRWLEDLASQMTESLVGAIAARVLDKSGQVIASGLFVGIGDGVADAFFEMSHLDAGVTGRAHVLQRFSSLPGHCLLTRREIFEAAGGFDAESAGALENAYADFGLRLTASGLACLWTPFVSLVLTSETTIAAPPPLTDDLIRRHIHLLKRDPAYSPALSPRLPLFCWENRPELVVERLPWRPLTRILTLNADFGGCGHYRIIDPSSALNAAYLAETSSSAYLFNTSETARIAPDCIVMQRQITDDQQSNLEQLRRRIKRPIAFELDDLMFDLPKLSPHHVESPAETKAKLKRGIGLCDRLVVSTQPLAEALRSMNSDIVVVPNYLPKHRWEGLTPARIGGKRPRVGWSGSISHVGDLEILGEVVRELAKEVDWVFMGLATDSLKPYLAEYIPGVPFEAYPEALANLNLDLALAPLELCRFNECKTNLKILEYGILGYPVIATNITPYQGAFPIRLVKNTRDQWVKAIREHIHDLDASYQAGLALQQHIRQNWMLEDHLDEWVNAWTRY